MKSASAAHDELLRLVSELGEDERLVLTALARRLLDGQRTIGRLDLARDGRVWTREIAEEAADMAIYAGFELVRRSLAGPRHPSHGPHGCPQGCTAGRTERTMELPGGHTVRIVADPSMPEDAVQLEPYRAPCPVHGPHDKSKSTRDTIPDIELGKAEPTHSDTCPICRKRI